MCEEIKTENSFKDRNKVSDMTQFVKNNRTYYTTRKEAEAVREKWDRIYHSEKEKAYYIRKVKKHSKTTTEEPLLFIPPSYRDAYEEAFGKKTPKRGKRRE